MTQTPYKVCPMCQQACVLSMATCGRCGFVYPMAVPARSPKQTPSITTLQKKILFYSLAALFILGTGQYLISHNPMHPVKITWNEAGYSGMAGELQNIGSQPISHITVEADYDVPDMRSGMLVGTIRKHVVSQPLYYRNGQWISEQKGAMLTQYQQTSETIPPGQSAHFSLRGVGQFNVYNVRAFEHSDNRDAELPVTVVFQPK